MREEDRLLLTVPEAALRLGVGRSFLYGLLMSGEVESIKLGRSRRVPVTALDKFVGQRLEQERLPTGGSLKEKSLLA